MGMDIYGGSVGHGLREYHQSVHTRVHIKRQPSTVATGQLPVCLWALGAGDRYADLRADLQKGSNRLPQKTLPATQLFGPAPEDIAARLADDETVVLGQATDLVLEITLGLDQLGPAVQDGADLMTRLRL